MTHTHTFGNNTKVFRNTHYLSQRYNESNVVLGEWRQLDRRHMTYAASEPRFQSAAMPHFEFEFFQKNSQTSSFQIYGCALLISVYEWSMYSPYK